MKKNQKEILIKGSKYKIKLIEQNRFVAGETDFLTKTITIVKDNNSEELKMTIIHELLHAYMYECGLKSYCNDETLIIFIKSIFKDLNKNYKNILNILKKG